MHPNAVRPPIARLSGRLPPAARPHCGSFRLFSLVTLMISVKMICMMNILSVVQDLSLHLVTYVPQLCFCQLAVFTCRRNFSGLVLSNLLYVPPNDDKWILFSRYHIINVYRKNHGLRI